MSDNAWANKIVGHGEENPEQLLAHPYNFRVHPKNQQDALLGAIGDIGFLRSVTVNKTTGHILDGHLRVTLALRTGQTAIPVEYVELTEAEEAEALATIDPLAALATVDAAKLDALLQDVQTGDTALQMLLDDLALDAEQMGGVGSNSNGEKRELTKSHHAKAVLSLEDVATFERALAATGKRNRGEALILICRAYLGEYEEQQERQLDTGLEGLLAAARALPGV